MVTDTADGQIVTEQLRIPKIKYKPMPQWQKYVCSAIVFCSIFFGSVYIAFQGPLYPKEAVKKGLTTTQYGIVFGIYELTCFINLPIAGTHMTKIGPTFMFIVGSAIMALFTVLFGLVTQFPEGIAFFGGSILFRIIRAVGDVAAYTAGWVLIMGLFPENIATSMAILNMLDFLGVTFGPLIGTTLYKINGFSLPYLVVGGLSVLMFILSVVFIKEKHIKPVQDTSKKPSYLQTLKNPSVIISMFSLFAIFTTNGCVLTLLEAHLRPLNLSEPLLGAAFTVFSGTNAVSSIIFGKVADKIGRFRLMSAIGLIILASGSIFLGPAPFIPITLTIPSVFVTLSIQGTGIGCVIINGLMGLQSVIAGNDKENVAANGLTCSLYFMVLSFSTFLGSTSGGLLYDTIGFPLTSMVTLGLTCLALISVFLAMMFVDKHQSQPESPLVGRPVEEKELSPMLVKA